MVEDYSHIGKPAASVLAGSLAAVVKTATSISVQWVVPNENDINGVPNEYQVSASKQNGANMFADLTKGANGIVLAGIIPSV